MYVCTLCVYLVLKGGQVGSLGTGVTYGWDLPCEYWEQNLGPLEELSVLLTVDPFNPAFNFKDSILLFFK